jgi:hypothetical protein
MEVYLSVHVEASHLSISPAPLSIHRSVESSRNTHTGRLLNRTVNIFYLNFRVSGVVKTGNRVGTLSLVNMIPLFAGPSFSFLAERLGIPLKVYRCAHRSAGFMTFTLVLIHVLSVVSQGSFSLSPPQHLFKVIVSPLTYPFLLYH